MDSAHQRIRVSLAADLLARVGGSRAEAGEAIGRAGDEGIDGVINEDRLGLNTIYIEAKKWEGPVSRPEIQKFVGALQGKRARTGVFITTSTFTSEARGYAANIDTKVVLIEPPARGVHDRLQRRRDDEDDVRDQAGGWGLLRGGVGGGGNASDDKISVQIRWPADFLEKVKYRIAKCLRFPQALVVVPVVAKALA
ncbi:MAG: restriction endonuclease [Thermoanaerobaculia bacterium]